MPTRLRFLRLLPLAAALALAALRSPAAEPASSRTVKLLTIGNSFAYNATERLPDFARAVGKTVHIFHANLGGASLERHAIHLRAALANPEDPQARPYTKRPDPKTGQSRDFSLPEALAADAWTHVTLQQASPLSFKPESYEPFASELIAAIKQHAPQAEIVILQTWAYRDDHKWFKNGPAFTPAIMHEQLRDAYGRLASAHGLRLLPVGDAFHAARQTSAWQLKLDPAFDYANPPSGRTPAETGGLHKGYSWERDGSGKPVLKLDGFHANLAGCYLGGAVLFESLFQSDVRPLAVVPAGLTPDQAADLRRLAHEAVVARVAK